MNKRKSRPANNSFVHNGNTIESGKRYLENPTFFANVGPFLAKSIPAFGKDPIDHMTKYVDETFKMSPVTENKVAKIIENFKDSAAGWDGLRPNALLKYHSPISENYPLWAVFSLSAKWANGVPLFKSGEDFVFTNYRPVSLLPVFSKLIERL